MQSSQANQQHTLDADSSVSPTTTFRATGDRITKLDASRALRSCVPTSTHSPVATVNRRNSHPAISRGSSKRRSLLLTVMANGNCDEGGRCHTVKAGGR